MLVPQLVMDARCTLGFQVKEMNSGRVCRAHSNNWRGEKEEVSDAAATVAYTGRGKEVDQKEDSPGLCDDEGLILSSCHSSQEL